MKNCGFLLLLLQTVNLGNNTSKVPRVLEILPLKVLNVGFSRIYYTARVLKVENNHSYRPNPLVIPYQAYVQFCTFNLLWGVDYIDGPSQWPPSI